MVWKACHRGFFVWLYEHEWHELLEGLDVFEGDLGIDEVVGAHGDTDDDVGGVAFFVVPAFDTGQSTTHDTDGLIDLEAGGSDVDGIFGIAQDVLELLHLVVGDVGVDAVLGSAVEHEAIDGGIAEHDAHELSFLGVDEDLARDDDGLLLIPIAAFIDLLLDAAGDKDLEIGLGEHGADGALLGSFALRNVPAGLTVIYGKARAFMQFCRAHRGIFCRFNILCHYSKSGSLLA